MRLLSIATLALFSAPLWAQPNFHIPTVQTAMQAHYQFHQHDLQIAGKFYRLFIAKPRQQTAPPAVLYTTDGNAQFPLAVNAVNPNLPMPLIVGVGYVGDKAYAIAERTRDYTFPAQGEAFAKGGGAGEFLQLLKNEIRPFVAQHYSFNSQNQTFFGHSFGGLFGLYVLLNQSELFQQYCLASPSLWWGNGEFLSKKTPWVTHKPREILITLGEYEQSPERDPNMTETQLAKINQRKAMSPMNALQLSENLQAQGNNAHFVLIPAKNHGDSIPNALQLCLAQVQNRALTQSPSQLQLPSHFLKKE